MNYADSIVLTGPEAMGKLTLSEGGRFVMIARGEQPAVVPLDDPGDYEIDALMIKPGTPWPVIIMVVQEEHARLFENMKPEQVSNMVDQAIKAISQ